MAGATQSGADSKKFVPKTFSKSDISDLAIKFQAFIGDNSHSQFGPVILIPADLLYNVFYDFFRISIDIFLDQ